MDRLIRLALLVIALSTLSYEGVRAQQQCGTVTTCPQASTPFSGSEILYMVQGGVSKRTTISQVGSAVGPFVALIPGSMPIIPQTNGGVLYDNHGVLGDSTTLPVGLTIPGAVLISFPNGNGINFAHVTLATEGGDNNDLVVVNNVNNAYTGLVVEPSGTPLSDPFSGIFLNIAQGANQQQLGIVGYGIAQKFIMGEIITGGGPYVPWDFTNSGVNVLQFSIDPYVYVPVKMGVGFGRGSTPNDLLEISTGSGGNISAGLAGGADYGVTFTSGGVSWRMAASNSSGNYYLIQLQTGFFPFVVNDNAPNNALSIGQTLNTVVNPLGFIGSSSGTATITAQASAGTPTLTLPNASGTFAVNASSPLVLSATTGALTCPTCLTANQTITLSGDATGSGATTITTTLATVNGNVGSFGSSTSIPSFTVNAKGLITAASGNVVIAPAGTLSGTTLNATVVTSSLTSVGTLASLTVIGVATNGGETITSASATAFSVGLNGATNPSFVVNDATALQAAGLRVTGAVTGGTVAVATLDSGAANNLTIDAKGTGTIGIGTTSTGAITLGVANSVNVGSGALGLGNVPALTRNSGTGALTISTNGANLILSPAGIVASTVHVTATSAAPSISSCGTSPVIGGSDNFGNVTAGSGVLSSCVINFGTTWGAAPSCTVSSPTAISSLTVTTSTTQITIGGTSLTGDVIKWVCGSTASLEPQFAPANDNEQNISYKKYA